MTTIDAIRKKHQPKKREHPPCSCGSTFFWRDVYHEDLHCAGCEDPPSVAMVRSVLVIVAGDLRDVTDEFLGRQIDQAEPEAPATTRAALPRDGETWDEFWERLPDLSEHYDDRVSKAKCQSPGAVSTAGANRSGTTRHQRLDRERQQAASGGLFCE